MYTILKKNLRSMINVISLYISVGASDNVRCFFCDGGLRNWESGDDPFEEHARWFSKCPYIREIKGDKYVDAVAVTFPVENNPVLSLIYISLFYLLFFLAYKVIMSL